MLGFPWSVGSDGSHQVHLCSARRAPHGSKFHALQKAFRISRKLGEERPVESAQPSSNDASHHIAFFTLTHLIRTPANVAGSCLSSSELIVAPMTSGSLLPAVRPSPRGVLRCDAAICGLDLHLKGRLSNFCNGMTWLCRARMLLVELLQHLLSPIVRAGLSTPSMDDLSRRDKLECTVIANSPLFRDDTRLNRRPSRLSFRRRSGTPFSKAQGPEDRTMVNRWLVKP
jgi:hypothetical protein